MAERLAAQIWIGGKISADLVDELCGAIGTQVVSLEWGDGQFLTRGKAKGAATTGRSSNTGPGPIRFVSQSMRRAIPSWICPHCVVWRNPWTPR